MDRNEWKQVRIEAAIAAMKALIDRQYPSSCEKIAEKAVKYADCLISELRKDEKTDNT